MTDVLTPNAPVEETKPQRLEDFFPYSAPDSFQFLPYLSQNDALLSQDARISREEMLRFQNRDVHKLLRATPHRFWTHVLFDTSFPQFISSYLRYAPRPFDPTEIGLEQPQTELNLYERKLESMLSRRIFFLYWRLVTEDKLNKHSTNFQLGEVLYDHWLIDIPCILDLSALFGSGNARLMKELLAKTFSMQPAYFSDLMTSVGYIAKAFNLEGEGNRTDRVKYLYDTTFALRSFLDLFPLGAFAFVGGEETFLSVLVNFYEKDLPKLGEKANESQVFQLTQIKLNILGICDAIMNECYLGNPLTPLVHATSAENLLFDALHKRYLQPYVQDPKLTIALCQLVSKQMDHVEQQISDPAELTKYLQNTFETPIGEFLAHYDRVYHLSHSLGQFAKKDTTLNKFIETLHQVQNKFGFTQENSTQLDAAVQQLQEMFPSYGAGYLQLALEYFDNSTERTLSALLDNNIPESLEKVEKSLTMQQLEHSRHTIVDSRKSGPPQSPLSSGEVSPMVWENADFFASMHIGKKNKTKDVLNELLDDGLRQRIVETYMYDDEYDDSYDDVANFDVGEGNAEEDSVSENLGIFTSQKSLPTSNPNRKPKKEKKEEPQKQQPTPVQQPKQEQTDEKPSAGRGRGYKKESTTSGQTTAPDAGRGRGRGYGQNKAHKKEGKKAGRKEMGKLFNQPQ